MINIHFSDEFLDYLKKEHGITTDYEDLPGKYTYINLNAHETHIEKRLINIVETYGIEKATDAYGEPYSLEIVNVPQFYLFKIHDYEGMQTIELIFPWEQLARAMIENRIDDPVRKAVENGELKLPKMVSTDSFDAGLF